MNCILKSVLAIDFPQNSHENSKSVVDFGKNQINFLLSHRVPVFSTEICAVVPMYNWAQNYVRITGLCEGQHNPIVSVIVGTKIKNYMLVCGFVLLFLH